MDKEVTTKLYSYMPCGWLTYKDRFSRTCHSFSEGAIGLLDEIHQVECWATVLLPADNGGPCCL